MPPPVPARMCATGMRSPRSMCPVRARASRRAIRQSSGGGWRSRAFSDVDDEDDNYPDDNEAEAGENAAPAREFTMAIGAKKHYKIRETLKRYWEKDLWTQVFTVLLNTGSEDSREVREREMGRVTALMEEWLEGEGERGGRDLRAQLRRAERLVGGSGEGKK
ncbi:MAG: hypothetical protein M1823_008187 [Watsoniomyces obsoletus]|nr:MAG: hypothetical protein M1823_008187 [Watsoniomyces obsoletus]